METLQQIAPDDPDSTLDTGWIERVTKQVAAETERLESELKGYKNNLIKESIRVCLSDQAWAVPADSSRRRSTDVGRMMLDG